MRRWLVFFLVSLYPRAWRRRFGDEFWVLLAQQPLTVLAVVDVVRGAIDAHRRARKRAGTATRQRSARRRASASPATAPASQRTSIQREEWEMARKAHRGRDLRCSFCGKRQEQVQRLIAGPRVYICDQCIGLCNEILAEVPPPAPSALSGRPVARHRTNSTARPWWRRLLERWRSDPQVSLEA
jgi:hypothetical protein